MGRGIQAMSKLDYALHYAKEFNWSVFPIKPNEKAPPLVKWKAEATSDEEQIRDWWNEWPDANIGVATGPSNLLVIDVDRKNGVNGDESVETLEMLHDVLPQTLVSQTPTGGRHIIYHRLLDVGNSVGKLGAGLDTRGVGGYIVAPGSTVEKGKYAFTDGPEGVYASKGEVETLPSWLTELLLPPVALESIDLDSDASEERAIRYLSVEAVPSIEGQGGDINAYEVACWVKDFGVSRERCIELMDEHWNHRCSPPWSLSELTIKVNNAYGYGQNELGSKAPVDFESIKDGTELAFRGSSLDIDNIPKRRWILGHRYIREFVTVTIAPGGVGKSMLTMSDLSLSVCCLTK